MECSLCEVQRNENAILFENDEMVGTLLTTGISKVHFKLFPKQHTLDFQKYKLEFAKNIKNIVETLKSVANAKDYNLLMNLGNANEFQHLSFDIIGRFENDNVIIGWKPDENAKSKLSETFQKLVDALKGYEFKIEVKQEIKEDDKEVKKFDDKGEEFMFFKRIP